MKGLTPVALVVGCVIPVLARSQSYRPRMAHEGSIVLNSAVTILESPEEPVPIQKAVDDLRTDFEKVMGKKPRIISREEDAGPVTILIGEKSELPEGMKLSGLDQPESFSISVKIANWKTKHATRVVLLAGADMRGTIYAIYQFSQEYLGIDPLHYWTDQQPVHRDQIELPASLDKTFPGPVFKYRGFFINDEDLLTGWAPGEKKDHTGISLKVWNKIYETILRLKGNMVCPGTWIFPDDPQIKLAGERGLIVTQHHAIPLGLNVARWPQGVPYNFTTHPEILERAWRDAVREYPPGVEVLWTVGLRGLSDTSYASMDPSVRGNNKALGQVISKAIAKQIQIVRAVHPHAQFITSLWAEGSRLMRQGDLTIPPEVGKVWADDGYGYLQDRGEVSADQGAYYHVAMMNGRANQLSEMVPVERIYSELGRYIKARATHYLLLNTSDIRPVLMTAKAVMDLAWGGVPPGGANASEDYYRSWSAYEFGNKAASRVASVYGEYFNAPAHFGQPERPYGDNYYHTEARLMMLSYMIDSPLYAMPSQTPKWRQPRIFEPFSGFGSPSAPLSGKAWLRQAVKEEIQRCGNAQPRWDTVWKNALDAEPLIPSNRRSFYRASVLAMIAINRESNQMLFQVAKAIQEAQNGQMSQARQSAAQALAALDAIHRAEAAAEYGKWQNWYRGDWLTGVYRTRQMVEIFSKFLSNPLTHLPPPIIWNGWEAYYHIMHYEGNRSADVN
ncbi:MAG: glycosyl hydrolase 115 family protein [Acidobacteria bacterium]|nr:glycosyl hydrolase 115 family protein [Acidobacteriota bacterium]